MANWPDPTAPTPPPSAGGRLTTVRLPVSEMDTHPYRYVLGYAHLTGYGSFVLNSDDLIADYAMIKRVVKVIEESSSSRNVCIIGMSLIAAPPNTPPLQVAISNHESPWRYFVSFFNGNGFSTSIMDLPIQLRTEDHITSLRKEICRQARLRDLAILAISLMAAPR